MADNLQFLFSPTLNACFRQISILSFKSRTTWSPSYRSWISGLANPRLASRIRDAAFARALREACLVACASTYARERIYATHVFVAVLRGSAPCGFRKNILHKRSNSHDACSPVCACAGRCNRRKRNAKSAACVLEWTYVRYLYCTCG